MINNHAKVGNITYLIIPNILTCRKKFVQCMILITRDQRM